MEKAVTQKEARRLWLHAQRLDSSQPFGTGPRSALKAVVQLGYVQIDTINVIERCHHHILFTRIPGYRRTHLHRAQSIDKTLFEYWTHALAYVPTSDFRFFGAEMKQRKKHPRLWDGRVDPRELQKLLTRIRRDGPLSLRDIDDDVLVEKDHAWASKKPSRRALQLGFYTGALTVSERIGMLKSYELTLRHFGWQSKPKPATEREIEDYLLDRALRAQSFVSLDSACHLNARRKPGVARAIARRVRRGELVPVRVGDAAKAQHWVSVDDLARLAAGELDPTEPITRLLSPFDPLMILRKRAKLVFDYEHRFEAYLPKEKRIFGYFALPVLLDDRIVAAIDLKTDRANRKLLLQKWTWFGREKSRASPRRIEEELDRFEAFQLGSAER
jgi:uncharacterized protein YcaQ